MIPKNMPRKVHEVEDESVGRDVVSLNCEEIGGEVGAGCAKISRDSRRNSEETQSSSEVGGRALLELGHNGDEEAQSYESMRVRTCRRIPPPS